MKKLSTIFLLLLLMCSTGCAKSNTKIESSTKLPASKPAVNFNLENKTVTLNSGHTIPVLGLGTWALYGDVAENSVYNAIKCGYRLIDTAQYYDNSEYVGKGIARAIKEGLVTRKDLFVTTKIVPAGMNDYDSLITDVISSLGLDYVDLMLVHQQGPDEVKLYKAMERAQKAGKIRSLGISNYYTQTEFDKILNNAEIIPAIVQNENHLFYQNKAFQQYISKYGTILESYYPLGGRGNTKQFLQHPAILTLAAKYKKTPAQIILRWHVQSHYIAIPGSSNVNHIQENFAIFDFSLADKDMQTLKDIDKQKRFENW